MKFLVPLFLICASSAVLAQNAQQAAQRNDLTLRTVMAQRDAAIGQAQLFQLDILDLQKELADLKRALGEAEKKAEPAK